jgi:heme o synthase
MATSLLLWPVARTGWLYMVAAVGLGGWFVTEAHLMRRRGQLSDSVEVVRPMRMFHTSNLYLTVLFVCIAFDTVAR